MTSNVKFTFSVDDTTHVIYNEYWARQIRIGDTNYNISVVGKMQPFKTHLP